MDTAGDALAIVEIITQHCVFPLAVSVASPKQVSGAMVESFTEPWRPSARYPPCRSVPLRDSIAEGVMHFALLSCGLVQVSLRYPSSTGYRSSGAHARGRGIAPNRSMLRHPKPHIAGYAGGGIAEIVSQ